MSLELLVVTVCGVGTFLLRFLPIWRARNRAQSRRRSRQELGRTRPVAATALEPPLRGIKHSRREFFVS